MDLQECLPAEVPSSAFVPIDEQEFGLAPDLSDQASELKVETVAIRPWLSDKTAATWLSLALTARGFH